MRPGAPLPPGKLPPPLLRRLLRWHGRADRRVVVGPQFGQDAAVIDLGDQYLVLKSDPVTFTADEVGWYAVNVNANDLATMGAVPAWFQATIIVPTGTTAAAVTGIFRDIHRAARALGIAVTGGHTEVSPSVRQPIVAGDLQGLVAHDRLVTSAGARPGDLVLLTKAAGIEGTAILARSFVQDATRVLGRHTQRTAARFHHRPGISVVAEALAAARIGAHAMHDPTEGGVAAGLYELAAASGKRLIIDLDRIPVLEPTERLCRHFGLSPLGLIGSGALLLTIAPERAPLLVRHLRRHRIAVSRIGTVAAGRGVSARVAGKRAPFVWSQQDELTKVFGNPEYTSDPPVPGRR